MTVFNQHDPDHEAGRQKGRSARTGLPAFLRSTAGRLTIISLSVVGVTLFVEHQAYLIDVLPWLLVLACPLLHVFMHRSHGGQSGQRHDHPHQVNPVRVPVISRPERPE